MILFQRIIDYKLCHSKLVKWSQDFEWITGQNLCLDKQICKSFEMRYFEYWSFRKYIEIPYRKLGKYTKYFWKYKLFRKYIELLWKYKKLLKVQVTSGSTCTPEKRILGTTLVGSTSLVHKKNKRYFRSAAHLWNPFQFYNNSSK